MLNENDLEEGVVCYRKEESSLALFKYNFIGLCCQYLLSYRYFKLKVIYAFVNSTKQR